MSREIAWVDGVNSAVMGFFAQIANPDVIFAHCDLGDSVHKDSHRFIDDLERWYEKPIIRLRSVEYQTIDDVFEKRKYISGPHGAPCTGPMKVVPRMNFQLPSDMHLWGYTADKLDAARFTRMQADHPLLRQRSPLIEMGWTKADSHAILAMFGIRRPYVYDIGMPNGNCLGCVKSSAPNYWSLMRLHFPEVFWRRDAQCRKLGAKIVILRREKVDGKWKNVRGFPSDVPIDQPTVVKGNFGGCGFHCPA